MPTLPPVRLTKAVLAQVPYLNCAPFFKGLLLDDSWELEDLSPYQLGVAAAAGRITAGPMSLVDYLRLQNQFERISHLGIAVRGRSGSALLFSRKPVRQLDGATIAVTEETSTTALLLRLILEVRYELSPKAYQRSRSHEADAVLLIGDEALAFRAANRHYSYEMDLAFEWWLWQHLPFVFAVWVVRRETEVEEKRLLNRAISKALAINRNRLETLAQERAGTLGLPAGELKSYLEQFVYRFGEPEERAITQFERLLNEHHMR